MTTEELNTLSIAEQMQYFIGRGELPAPIKYDIEEYDFRVEDEI